jgi:hypothetical protein
MQNNTLIESKNMVIKNFAITKDVVLNTLYQKNCSLHLFESLTINNGSHCSDFIIDSFRTCTWIKTWRFSVRLVYHYFSEMNETYVEILSPPHPHPPTPVIPIFQLNTRG